MHLSTTAPTRFSPSIIATLMVQRFTQLGVTVSAHNFFGRKLAESVVSQAPQGQQRTFVLPQRKALSQAA